MIKRGEIYWVQLDPTVGSEIQKTRPAVVVSNNSSNQASSTITIVPLTSQIKHVYPFEVLLPLGTAGLTVASKAKANQIRTVAIQRLAAQPLGGLADDATMQQIEAALKIHLALS